LGEKNERSAKRIGLRRKLKTACRADFYFGGIIETRKGNKNTEKGGQR
jgi:hypothetical protein